jgi:hypothetical protein
MSYRTNHYKSKKFQDMDEENTFKKFLSYLGEIFKGIAAVLTIIGIIIFAFFLPSAIIAALCWAVHNYILCSIFSSVQPIGYWSCVFIVFLCTAFISVGNSNGNNNQKS